jgi:TonB family protein
MSTLIDISKKWEGRLIEGKFPLQKWLGGSEHSAVFLTERNSGNGSQKAAIKLVLAKALSAEKLEEETALSRWADGAGLSHPHLLRLYESGRCQLEDERFLYVVMEYADEDLAQVIPQRSLSPAEVKEMLPPTADALSFLHNAGFVHAHVKPSNVMAVNNQLKISADHLRKTGDRNGKGVTVYDAPEVSSVGLSPAADVWSLGVMLVEVLTQHEPMHKGSNGEQIVIPDKIPQPFHDIAERSLRVDPQQRCSMNEILSKLTVPKPVAATPPVPVRKSIETAMPIERRNRWAIPIVVALSLALILAGRRFMVQHPSSPSAQSPANSQAIGSPTVSGKVTPAGSPSTPSAISKASQTGDSPGSVLHQVMPEVSPGALNTVHGHIKVGVQVSVDASGDVSQAHLISAGPSKYFANKALAAARGWTFTPPQTNGQASPSKWILRFQIARSSIQVFPAEIKP